MNNKKFKDLHPLIAEELKKILNQKEIIIEHPNPMSYKVLDFTGRELITCSACAAWSEYTLHTFGNLVAYFPNNKDPKNRAALDIVDTIEIIYVQQRMNNALTLEDRKLLDTLRQYTSQIVKEK